MESNCDEAVTKLQCLLTQDSTAEQSHMVVARLCKSDGEFDVMLQEVTKWIGSLKNDDPYHAEIDVLLYNTLHRLDEEVGNSTDLAEHMDTELEVCLYARLEQTLDFCASCLQKNRVTVNSLACLAIVLDANASFNKTYAWTRDSNYPKGSRLTQLINHFGTCDGFESVRLCLRHAKDLSIAQLAALFRPFGQCYKHLSPDTIRRYFLPVADAVCAHLLSCSDRQLFQQDVTATELPLSLVGPRSAYVIVESVMNLLNVLKGEDKEVQNKVQYWQDTILTRLKHALEDEANSSDSSSSSNNSRTTSLAHHSRRTSQDSNASLHSSISSHSAQIVERNSVNNRSCQTLPCVVNSVTHETLDKVDKLARTMTETVTTDTNTNSFSRPENGTRSSTVSLAQEAVSLDMALGPLTPLPEDLTHDVSQPSTSYAKPPGLVEIDELEVTQSDYRASADIIPKEVIIWNPPIFETSAAYAGSAMKPMAMMFDSSESSSMVSTAPSVPRSASELGNTCRVCFEAETSSKNRLIRPCRCSGSAASIHRQCLVKWIHISGHRRCEVCGARFSYVPMSERMRGFMDKFRNNRRWRNAAFAILVGLVVILYLIIFAVFPRGIMSQTT